MKKFTRSAALVVGLAVLSTTPIQSFAASFKALPVITAQDGVVENVHRRRYRHRHHRHNNRGNVAAGIIGGLIIGGIIANSARRSAERDEDHLDWCYERYRSYRARDNTFQPYEGPRRQCRSPYY